MYTDHPREAWPDLSKLATSIKPLDLNSVAATVAGGEVRPEIDPDLVVGHLHLHVGDLQHSLAFYRDVLGFDLKTHLPGAAAFVSAGGYHHHLGFNVWRGTVSPTLVGRVGLRHWTILLEKPEEVVAVRERVQAANIETDEHGDGGFFARDPWGIAVYFGTTGTVAA